MRHDAAKRPLIMSLHLIHLSRLVHIHHSLIAPLVVVRDAPVVRAVGHERVLVPAIVAVRTSGQEVQRLSVWVRGEGVGEAPVGVFFAFFAAELGWGGLGEEDAVLGGEVDVVGGVLLVSCGGFC